MLDTRHSRVTVGGEPVTLTSHEYRVLDYLMHHQEQMVSRSDLIDHIYAQDFDRDSNRLRSTVGVLPEQNASAC